MENNIFELTNTTLEVKTNLKVECQQVQFPGSPDPVPAVMFSLRNPQVALNQFKFLSADEHLNYAITDKAEITRLIELLEQVKDQL